MYALRQSVLPDRLQLRPGAREISVRETGIVDEVEVDGLQAELVRGSSPSYEKCGPC